MDTLRGTFDRDNSAQDADDFDLGQEDLGAQLPPAAIGQDERRMQVRAYNHWASLLGERNFPSIEELEPENLPDFGPFSVLLDFSVGIEDPAIRYIGGALADECDASEGIEMLSDVPARSLLSRITDHYMQILANQAPIGFEAEFVNQRGATILYRGILLPFSSDDDTIDFIYGVINWKEMADAATTDELLLELDQALEGTDHDAEESEDIPQLRPSEPLTEWADSPSAEAGKSSLARTDDDGLPEPAFGDYALGDDDEEGEEEANYSFASLSDHIAAPPEKSAEKPEAIDLEALSEVSEDAPLDLGDFAEDAEFAPETAPMPEPLPEPMTSLTPEPEQPATFEDAASFAESSEDEGLYDCLAAARELAHSAHSAEDRSRKALYDAVGRAYDFSILAAQEPAEFDELVAENGLAVQERAPMTPIVKLVFGADYDKTRLTEYATVLGHAQRIGLERGELADFLGKADGGLKGVVTQERHLRRVESGQQVEPKDTPRAALAKKLRKLEAKSFDELPAEGAEFAVVVIRRTEEGEVVMLGEVADDIALTERAARKLLG